PGAIRFDAALIAKCADPSLKTALVEKFIAEAGSSDPLAVTVEAGERLVLVPAARMEREAMETIKRFVGNALVRVRVTQFPAGIGVEDVSF
ncbi:MAG: conjugal transfer protein TraH, partial [Pararhizobium sp.]